jgi:hypothetical protein
MVYLKELREAEPKILNISKVNAIATKNQA